MSFNKKTITPMKWYGTKRLTKFDWDIIQHSPSAVRIELVSALIKPFIEDVKPDVRELCETVLHQASIPNSLTKEERRETFKQINKFFFAIRRNTPPFPTLLFKMLADMTRAHPDYPENMNFPGVIHFFSRNVLKKKREDAVSVVLSTLSYDFIYELFKRTGHEATSVEEELINALVPKESKTETKEDLEHLRSMISDVLEENPTHLEDAVQVMKAGRWNEANKLFQVILRDIGR